MKTVATLIVPVETRPLVFKGQTVITTELLAQAYETDSKNIQMNFSNNKSKFKVNIHYVLLQGDDLKGFKNDPNNIGLVGKNASQLYLWTERGASRHCKILDTEKAWEQFDYLEDTYFKVKEQINPLEGISTELQAILMQDKKLQVLDNRIGKLENEMTIDYGQQNALQTIGTKRVIHILGGKQSLAYKLVGKKAFNEIWKFYKNTMNIASYKDTAVREFERGKELLLSWVPSQDLDLMIKGANMQVSNQ